MRKLQFSLSKGQSLLRDSFPLVLSSALIVLYMRIDQIMIAYYLDSSQVGLYSSAVKLTESTFIIGTIICTSIFPMLQKTYTLDEKEFKSKFVQLYGILIWIGLAISFCVSLLSNEIVAITFGTAYANAAPALAINIWSCVFVFLGVAHSKLLLIRNQNMTFLNRNLIGLIINVVLNIILIPRIGIIGAAYATLISQIYVGYLHDYVFMKWRDDFWLKTKSVIFVYE